MASAIVLVMCVLFAFFVVSTSQANTNLTSPDVIYSIANNSEKIDFNRGFLITIMPVGGGNFATLTHISIPTNLSEGSRVTVSIVAKDGSIRKLLMSLVKKHRISFYTKRSGIFQIMKVGN